MDKRQIQKKKLSFPIPHRGHDTKHKLLNPGQSDRNLDFLDCAEEPDSKKPRLGEAPAENIPILNQNQQQMIVSNIIPHPQPACSEVVNETSAIYKSMHVVMEEMNEIVGEAKFVINAMNRMAKSKHENTETPEASHPHPHASGTLKKGNEKKVKCTTPKDNSEPEKIGIGQRRKHGSEFGNIDELQSVRPRPLMSARRLFFDPEENESMDCND